MRELLALPFLHHPAVLTAVAGSIALLISIGAVAALSGAQKPKGITYALATLFFLPIALMSIVAVRAHYGFLSTSKAIFAWPIVVLGSVFVVTFLRFIVSFWSTPR